MGADYQPALSALMLPNLQALAQEAETAQAETHEKKALLANVRNTREQAFRQLEPLARAILATLEIGGAGAHVMANAQQLYRKIRGVAKSARKTNPADPAAAGTGEAPAAEEEKSGRSIYQLSYDMQVSHLDGLVALAKADPAYQTNEPTLKPKAMAAQVRTLSDLNQQVAQAELAWNKALHRRNQLFYHPDTGMCAVAKKVKKYLTAVFGRTHIYSQQVRELTFKSYKF
jgi:hypothetical protein